MENSVDILEEKKLIQSFCKEKNLSYDQLENKLILLVLSKMYENNEKYLIIDNDKIKLVGQKLEQYFNYLGFNCRYFKDNYNDLKIHIVLETLKNNYGEINENYNCIYLDIPRYEIIKNKKEYKNISSIVDKSYRIITENPLTKNEEIKIINNKNIEVLIENLDMINLVTNPLNLEFITLKEFNDLFLEYQMYFKQKINEILYLEYLDESYTNIYISKYKKDKYGSSLVINLEENYGKSYKPLLFLEEVKDNIKNYTWDKSRIIKRQTTLDNLFKFVETNETYFQKRPLRLSTNNELCEISYNSNNEDNIETLNFIYDDSQNNINIKTNYNEEELKYKIYINDKELNIEDYEKIETLNNIYISTEYLPKFIKDYINLKAKKAKRKERRIN